jgi:uncharacterized membrane protein
MTKKHSTQHDQTAQNVKEAASKKRGVKLVVSTNFIAMLGVCAVLGYLALVTVQGLAAVESVEPLNSTQETVSIPTLKLNQSHARRGPAIEVRDENIGKDNPFSQY